MPGGGIYAGCFVTPFRFRIPWRIIQFKRHRGTYEPFYRPQLAAMHELAECKFCSGGVQYRHPDTATWGKIPAHMLHKVREPGGDIIFNADPLYTDIRDCKECAGRGGVHRFKEEAL